MELTNAENIRALLSRHGFRFSRSLGQNFLCAAWVPERIAESAGLDGETGVLEVGPGIGCLTRELSRRAGRVIAVELDGALRPVLGETLSDCENVELLFGNILKTDLPALTERGFAGLKRRVVCANLPYNITSPALTALIGSGCFDSLTVMLQHEVALRICAAANTADYGAFTVFVQWHCLTERLFDVPPGCFIPAPKVTSSVIRLSRRPAPPYAVSDEKLFFAVVRAAFNQRRKTLLNALSNMLSGYSRETIQAAIAACGLDARIRGEALSLERFAALSNELSKAGGCVNAD